MNNNWSDPMLKLERAQRLAGEHACAGEWEQARAELLNCVGYATDAIDATRAEQERRERLEVGSG